MKTLRIEEQWQNKFLNKGTEFGCGDLSIMIGTVSEIVTKAHQAGIDEAVKVAKAHYYTVNVDKQPTIQDEAWANQYDSKAEAFWYGEAKGLEALDDTIKALQDNK